MTEPSILRQVDDLLAGRDDPNAPKIHLVTAEGRAACNKRHKPAQFVTLEQLAEGTAPRLTCRRCFHSKAFRKVAGWYIGLDDWQHPFHSEIVRWPF